MLRRAGTVLATAAVVCAAGATPALARDPWIFTDCQQNPYPGCELGAGRSGGGETPEPDAGGPPPGADRGQTPGGTGLGEEEEKEHGDTIIGDADVARCDYERSDYQPAPGTGQPVPYAGRPGGPPAGQPAAHRPAPGAASAAPVAPTALVQVAVVTTVAPVAAQPPEPELEPPAAPAPESAGGPGEGPGAWYVYRCSTPGVRDALYRPPVWIPDADAAVPAPSAAQLAAQARSRLRLPTLPIATNPAGDQLVRLPSWLWLDPAGWAPVAATAAAAGVSVTAVARPVQVGWAMGDGGTVTCTGPGTPHPPGADPHSPSPDCGHTYRTSSAANPGGVFGVTATVGWEVTWAGAGQAGTFPGLTTTTAARIRVITVNALTTGGG